MIKLRQLKCSFCYKNESQVRKLVAGPHVYICDECCMIVSRIMSNEEPPYAPAVEPTVWRKFCRWLGSLLHYKNQATFVDPS